MTHQSSKPVRLRTVAVAPPSVLRKSAVGAAPKNTAIRSSTSFALSMMVALRYLEGRSRRTAAEPSEPIPAPVAL